MQTIMICRRDESKITVGALEFSAPLLLLLFFVAVPFGGLWCLVAFGLNLVQIRLIRVEGEAEVQQLEGAVHVTPHNVGGLQVGVHIVGAV